MLSSYCYSFLLVHDEIIGLNTEKHELSGITTFFCANICVESFTQLRETSYFQVIVRKWVVLKLKVLHI